MKRFLLTMAVAILMGVLSRDGKLAAASPYAPIAAGPAAPLPAQGAPGPLVANPVIVPAPAAVAVPAPAGMVVPAPGPAVVLPVETIAGPTCGHECAVKTKKICVTEEQPRTKKVYSSCKEDYCRKCFLMKYLPGGKTPDDGCQGCTTGVCGKPCKRCVLIVKKVDICPAKPCVVREVLDESCPKGKCAPTCSAEHGSYTAAPLRIATSPEPIAHTPAVK